MDAKPPPQAKQSRLTLYLERWEAVNSRNGPQTMASKMVQSVWGREALLSNSSFFSFLQAYGIGSGAHTNLRQPSWNPQEELARGLLVGFPPHTEKVLPQPPYKPPNLQEVLDL